jgi:hypothetical protein
MSPGGAGVLALFSWHWSRGLVNPEPIRRRASFVVFAVGMWSTPEALSKRSVMSTAPMLRPCGRRAGPWSGAGFRRRDRAGGRCGRDDPAQRRHRWDHGTLQSATILDRVVSHVTVTDPRHSLFGSKIAVLPERSGRGPAYVVVELSDGRRRSIRKSSTDLGEPPITANAKGSAVPRISVRTLIPLTRHLNASLALLVEEVIRDGNPSGTRCVSATPASGLPASPVGKKSSVTMVEVAGRDAKAGSSRSCRVDTTNASRHTRKGDHPC